MKKIIIILGCLLGCLGCATTHDMSDLLPYEAAQKHETVADSIGDVMSSAAGATAGALLGDAASDSDYAPILGAYIGGEAMRGMHRWNVSKRNKKWEQGVEMGRRMERLDLLNKMQPGQMMEEKKSGTSEYMAKQRALKRIPPLEIKGVKYDSYYEEVPVLK